MQAQPEQLDDLINKISKGAKTILVIGDLASDMTNPVPAGQKIIPVSEQTLDHLSKQGLFDLVLIIGLLENLSHEKAEHIIAQIRDTHAREMLLVLSKNSGWSDTDLLGLNLRKITEIKQQDETLHAWYFALDNYKRVPHWLNSRYWANPEMFEKYRW